MKLARRFVLATALLVSAGVAAQTAGPTEHTAADDTDVSPNEIVVTGYADIVVNGRARRCRPVSDDPLDRVRVASLLDYSMIVPDEQGGYAARRVTEQITGPEFWQRVGIGMGAYRFRAPSADTPMCIGGRADPGSFAGFRRIVDATPYRGHRMRFTAWVATRDARQVSFWLATGGVIEGGPLLNGGNTNNVRFGGDHGWTPVLIETGPIDAKARHISYGFNLQGWGDVWVYQPTLEVVTDPLDSARTGDRIVIGYDKG